MNQSKLALLTLAMTGLYTQVAHADAMDFVPHLTPGLVGVQLGDALLSARSTADLGLRFVKSDDGAERYESFADAQLELELSHKLSAGGTIGFVGKLHAEFVTDVETGDTTGTDSFDPEEQKALAYVSGALGRFEAGYLHASGQAVTGNSIVTGRGGLSNNGLTYDVAGLGARYRFRSGSNTVEVQADQDLRAKAGYQFKRSYIGSTYSVGGDAVYADEETFDLPARANSVLASRLVRSFGAVLGGQMDYGTLSTSISGGAEHFQAKTGDDDTETRLFASAGVSKKWGRTTLSAAAAFERYMTAKYNEAELALGAELALSRGITLVGGYNLTYAFADQPLVGVTDDAMDHEVELAVRLFF